MVEVNYSKKYEDIAEDGIDAIDLSGKRKRGKIILPNERLAILWRKFFRVQFTDGGWQKDDECDVRNTLGGTMKQMEHPFSYACAEIEIDKSRKYPLFEDYKTHEKMRPPKEHFEPVPHFFSDMVGVIGLIDNDYTKEDLMDDLNLFKKMDFKVASIEKCSRCNPNIY